MTLRHGASVLAARPGAFGATLLIAAVTSRAPAADVTWTGAGDAYDGVAGAGGWYNFVQNWSPADVPDPNDTAVFDLVANYTVSLPWGPVNDGLEVLDGTVYLRSVTGHHVYSLTTAVVSGGTLVADDLDLSVAGDLAVYGPPGGSSNMHVWPASAVTCDRAVIGSGDGDGSLVIDGAGASLTTLSTTEIGNMGETGTLTVANGATADLGAVWVGYDTAAWSRGYLNVTTGAQVTTDDLLIQWGGSYQHGEVLVTDPGSTVTMNGGAALAVSDGLLRIESGGVLTSGTGPITVGSGDSLQLTGGTLNANGPVYVHGTLTCDAAAALSFGPGVETTVSNGGQASFGGPLAFDRTMTVTDAGSSLDVTGDLVVGDVGTGRLTVETSATATSGNLYVGDAGVGTLDLDANGALTSAIGRVGFGAGSVGTANVTWGSWTNSSFMVVGDSGSGTMTVGPNASVSATFGYLAYNAAADGHATVDGTWTLANNLSVALRGTADLTIGAGGTVSNVDGNIGFQGTADGTVTVTGTDAEWLVSGPLRVGRFGTGTLDVLSAGYVSSGHAYIGDESTGVGTATVDGSVFLGDRSTWDSSGNFYVGYRGDGALTARNNGRVNGANLHVGDQPGATGTVSVDGGRVVLANYLRVGVQGSGSASVLGGGKMELAGWSAFIGQESGSQGTVSVTGSASELNGVNNLYAGRYGTGTLDVTLGGRVESQYGYVGRYAGGTGTVTVDGGSWGSTASVWVGGGPSGAGGAGILRVLGWGGVDIGDTLRVWAPGTVELQSGGLLVATTIDHTGGGTFDFTGGTLGTATFLGDLVNAGGTLDPTIQYLTIGATSVSGDYVQAGGVMSLDLAGAGTGEYESVAVGGTATLDGWLDLAPWYLPSPGDSLTIVTAGAIEGAFDNAGAFVDVASGRFEVEYTDTEVILSQFVQMPPYCWSRGSCDPYYDPHIARVELGAIDNTTACSSYSDFAVQAAEIVVGGSHLLRVTTSGVSSSHICEVWVDWNQDRDFDDAGETLAVSGTPGPGPYTVNVSPPTGAPTGVARLRVRCSYGSSPGACGESASGEVEDYSLLVVTSASCPADVSGDGLVDVTDLLRVLAMWGGPGADATADGDTDVADLLLVLAEWGLCP
ncbi:MAG: GEVED domain-containing protein [Planctomycetota bacterium]|jgi:T5SS/PEP-CTERM-associated repeat protein